MGSIAPGTGQRGVPRPNGSECDIGVVELVFAKDIISANSAVAGSSFSFTVATTGTPVPSMTKRGQAPERPYLYEQRRRNSHYLGYSYREKDEDISPGSHRDLRIGNDQVCRYPGVHTDHQFWLIRRFCNRNYSGLKAAR
jgi:hypothetical protein